MRKFFSANYTAGAVNTAMLLLRIITGCLMMKHGYDKLVNFEGTATHMINFMGIGVKASTALVIFAEFFCSFLVIIGLFTRLAVIPLIIVMSVVLFMVTKGDLFGKGEIAALYLGCYLVLLLVGPGRVSVDSLIGK